MELARESMAYSLSIGEGSVFVYRYNTKQCFVILIRRF